ncbi:hypothetical protein [Tessaracoccus coleopterorum]
MFFLATGFHGLHVVGGVIAMWFVLARSLMTRTHTTSRRWPPTSCPTTGTSSTSSGSCCSASSTSSAKTLESDQ